MKMRLILNSKVMRFKFLFFLIVSQGVALTVARSDILLHIASQCVESIHDNYCTQCMLPRNDAGCGEGSECKKTTDVWALNEKYAAIRDIKMCGCHEGFIHGLAMPRDAVTGVEDPNRQEGIWQFAWDVALERMEPESIALVVNPKSQRTQNQLHVHLVRLEKNARAMLSRFSPVYVRNLEEVWSTAGKAAKAQGLNEYGVLVAQESYKQFIVVVTANSPEAAFTIWSCN